MAQQHKINATNIDHITQADWDTPTASDLGLDGYTPIKRWRRHTWRSNVMTAAEFNTLYTLEGAKCSITTTDYSDRNNANYLEYNNVDFQSIRGLHAGPRFEDVVIEFMVLV